MIHHEEILTEKKLSLQASLFVAAGVQFTLIYMSFPAAQDSYVT